MPISESEEITRDKLHELRKKNLCAECGLFLNVFMGEDGRAFLACNDWHRTHHDEGIAREPSHYEIEGVASLNIETRREILEQEHGVEKTKMLEKYIGGGVITKSIATEIVESLWGAAPQIEKTKAILLCQAYQLNPLMKHLYLVGYRRKTKDGKYILDQQGDPVIDWSMMLGIGATRLMAQRKHHYSYLDMTPRKATTAEVEKILGDTADPKYVYGFVWIKDVDTGAEAFGLRGCNTFEKVKNTEKGNTPLNMACVRAERLALDRQYPGEMPPNIEVVDERFMDVGEKVIQDAEYRVVNEHTGEITELITDQSEETKQPEPEQHRCQEHGVAYEQKFKFGKAYWSHSLPEGKWCNEKKTKAAPAAAAATPAAVELEPEPEPTQESRGEDWAKEPEPQPEPEPVAEMTGFITTEWLKASLKILRDKKFQAWEEASLLGYMKITYSIEAATVLEAAAMLPKEKAAHFVKKIQETLDMA